MKTPAADHRRKTLFLTTLLSSTLLAGPAHASESVEDYLDLDLEDLLSMEVTSVSKKKQRLTEAAAAIYVITQEDIRRSGVTSIPEALRMAPGVQVALIDANSWAITSRGFNGQWSNKLLVMIDGRSVYAPSFSGVNWDVQDTLLEDIDRIEVIRGPGATLWGANAVNGVINIITKYASDTQGGLVTLGAGNEEKGFAGLRYGEELDENTQGRFYAKYFERDSYVLEADGSDAGDDWKSLRAGFRIDAEPTGQDQWTLQGDLYNTDVNQVSPLLWLDPTTIDPDSIDPATPPYTMIPTIGPGVSDTIENSGWNLLARWNHSLTDQSSTALQVYYDHTEREEIFLGRIQDTLDIDFQHNLTIGERQELIWGLGYRNIRDDFDNSFSVSFDPDHDSRNLYSAFIQDQIELAPENFYLTLGSKFEHNDYTGYEIQPSIRALWKPDVKSSLWGSVSRAVRTPSRFSSDGQIVIFSGVITTGNPFAPIVPVTGTINGNENIDSEALIAYELGYRIQPLENLSLDLAAYYNDYENLQTNEVTDGYTVVFGNKMSGHATGLEIAMDWRPSLWWRIQASYSNVNLSLDLDSDSQDLGTSVQVGEGSSPEHQISLRSSMDLTKEWELDLWAYYVDTLPVSSSTALRNDIEIKSYTSLNVRLGWRPRKKLEFSLVGQNLQGGDHTEFIGNSTGGETQVERSVYGKIRWDF